jgi:hypothetical protein
MAKDDGSYSMSSALGICRDPIDLEHSHKERACVLEVVREEATTRSHQLDRWLIYPAISAVLRSVIARLICIPG